MANVGNEGNTINLEDEGTAETVEGAVEVAEEVESRGQWGSAPLHQRKLIRLPSRADQERHRRCHIPFAPWCPECVAGRKPNWGHYTVTTADNQRTYPEFHLDYCFFRNRPGGQSTAVLVAKDRSSRALAAHVVPWKGATVEWIIQQLRRDLAKWGLRDTQTVILRSDNEPALQDLLVKLASPEARNPERSLSIHLHAIQPRTGSSRSA